MKVSLNLTSAFTLRKRINEIASQFDNTARFMQLVVEPEEKETVLAKFKNGSFEDAVELSIAAHRASAELTKVIEQHNAEGKAILSKLQHQKTLINVFTGLSVRLSQSPLRKERNPVTGVWETRSLVKVTDYDFDAEIKKGEQVCRFLEDQLSKHNAETKFDFELDDNIYHEIYG